MWGRGRFYFDFWECFIFLRVVTLWCTLFMIYSFRCGREEYFILISGTFYFFRDRSVFVLLFLFVIISDLGMRKKLFWCRGRFIIFRKRSLRGLSCMYKLLMISIVILRAYFYGRDSAFWRGFYYISRTDPACFVVDSFVKTAFHRYLECF